MNRFFVRSLGFFVSVLGVFYGRSAMGSSHAPGLVCDCRKSTPEMLGTYNGETTRSCVGTNACTYAYGGYGFAGCVDGYYIVDKVGCGTGAQMGTSAEQQENAQANANACCSECPVWRAPAPNAANWELYGTGLFDSGNTMCSTDISTNPTTYGEAAGNAFGATSCRIPMPKLVVTNIKGTGGYYEIITTGTDKYCSFEGSDDACYSGGTGGTG